MKMKTLLVLPLLAFAFVLNVQAQKWEQVGKKGDWANTVEVVPMSGFIYSIEKDGTLFETDPSGKYRQLGDKGEFRNVDNLAALDGWLWTVGFGR